MPKARQGSGHEEQDRARRTQGRVEGRAEAAVPQETKRIVESAGARCLLLCGDLTDATFCADAVKATVRELGGLDILVSNAAHQSRKKSLHDLTDAELDRTFKTNVYAYFRLARAALKHMSCR